MSTAFGTRDFMAPEQASEGIVSEAADIYSLGVTLPYLFWNAAPGAMAAARHGERGEAEQAVARLVDAMIRQAPDERPRQMSDVREALQRALALEPLAVG
jgi:serine/threonine protein kinase